MGELMHLKILLPFRVFADVELVTRITLETCDGLYGLLPQRLDCVAALVPGIFSYEAEGKGVQYLAVDEGVMVKAGQDVLVSVRNAFGGADLGRLRDKAETIFRKQAESERDIRSVIAKMESDIIMRIDKLRKQ